MIGYLLERELGNVLGERPVASLHHPDRRRRTRSRVPQARRNRSVRSTTKPARTALARDRGWTVAPDGNDWRRVVASPTPRSIVGAPDDPPAPGQRSGRRVRRRGRVPVVIDSGGARHGVEAVVDKDLASALLARQLGADLLLLLTDVAAVELDWGTAKARPLRTVTPTELATYDVRGGLDGTEGRGRVRRSCGRRASRAVIGALADTAPARRGCRGHAIVRARCHRGRPALPSPVSEGAYEYSGVLVGRPRDRAARRARAARGRRTTSRSSGKRVPPRRASARIPATKPDVAIVDMRLPDGNGVEVCREVRSIDELDPVRDPHLVLRRRGAVRLDHGRRGRLPAQADQGHRPRRRGAAGRRRAVAARPAA